jgi:hypothetical protein
LSEAEAREQNERRLKEEAEEKLREKEEQLLALLAQQNIQVDG